MNKHLKYSVAAILTIIGGFLFYNKVYIEKSTFDTMKAYKGNLHVNVRAIGNVDAKDIYEITPQNGGKIEDIFFDEGERVKKGDLLFTIDPVDLPALLDEANISLKKAIYEANTAKSNLEGLKAQKALLKVTYDRYEKLLKQKFISKAEYDKAKSDLQNINAKIDASNSKISSARSEESRLKKSIEAIEIKLRKLNIYSPVDGYIIAKQAQKAQYVLPSVSVFKIVDPKTLWIKARIDERAASQIKLMQKASITLRSKPEKKLSGRVKRVVAMSDPVTLEREVAVGFDDIPYTFFINEQAEVNIETALYKEVLKVPIKLLVTNKGEKGIWIAQGDRAYFKPIFISAQNDEEAVVLSGIDKESELLLYTDKNRPLRNGMKIFR